MLINPWNNNGINFDDDAGFFQPANGFNLPGYEDLASFDSADESAVDRDPSIQVFGDIGVDGIDRERYIVDIQIEQVWDKARYVQPVGRYA